jgi:hypothetical protein
MATTITTIKSKARIIPSAVQQTAINGIVREIESKLEVLWDGITWSDESSYILSAKGDFKMEGDLGEGMSGQADFQLENTTKRFLPENALSPIQTYLKPRKQVRYSIIVAGTTFLLFTGYIKAIEPRRNEGTVNFHCFDNSEVVLNKETPQEQAYLDTYAHELITILGEAAGMDADTDIDVEQSRHLIRGAYFGDRNIWPVMGELAVAERGRVFFDINGRLKFWSRDHIQNQSAVLNLSRDNDLLELNFNIEEQHIKNYVTVKARPRAGAGIQPVWTNGSADILNPYTSTLVWIPAHGTQYAYLEIEDAYGPLPCTTWIQPVAETDYTANTLSDGTGTDMTGAIRINTFTPYADSVYLEVQNLSSVDIYLTKFQVRANPLKIWKWIQVRHKDETSIADYGNQQINIENDFIDDEQMANDIAETEVARWKDAKNMFNAKIIGIPYLQVGDVVNVEVTDSNYEEYMIYGMTWDINSQGFTQSLEFVNKVRFPTTQTVSARANIFNTQTQTVEAKARIGTVFQTVQSLARITEFTTIPKTMTAKARILGKKTVTAQARVKTAYNKTITSKANIQ